MGLVGAVARTVLPDWISEELSAAQVKRRSEKISGIDPSEYPAFVKKRFSEVLGRELDLECPRTFNEKIQWLKLFGSTPEKGRLADKYLVRSYVAERIGEEHLVPLLGVWDDPEEIDFDALPNRFVLKATHGSGWNIIVQDKRRINVQHIRRLLRLWLETDYCFLGFELHYHFCEPRIIAEEYMENLSPSGDEDLFDYKFWCFGGRCEFIQFFEGRSRGVHTAIFNRNWERQPFSYDRPRVNRDVPKPDNLEEMINYAERLAGNFAHVRVDFYRLDDGSIVFGEMTFAHHNGLCIWNPPETDIMLGNYIALPEKKIIFEV